MQARHLGGLALVILGLAGFAWMSVVVGLSGMQTGADRWLAPLLRWGALTLAFLGGVLIVARRPPTAG